MITTIVIDCDGCLTDGRKIVNSRGEREQIAFHSRDNEAAALLLEAGYRVIVVTAARFPGVRRYWQKYGVEVYYLRDKAHLDHEAGFEWPEAIGIGDDLMDVPFLRSCAFAYVPADAHPALLRQFTALNARGGSGVLSEVWALLESRSLVFLNADNINAT